MKMKIEKLPIVVLRPQPFTFKSECVDDDKEESLTQWLAIAFVIAVTVVMIVIGRG
jgi:hypothetical protein